MKTKHLLTGITVVLVGIGGIAAGLNGNITAACWTLVLLISTWDLHMQCRINELQHSVNKALGRRLDWADIEADVLRQIRNWLKSGAVIKAIDPAGDVLSATKDGHYIGGLLVTWSDPDSQGSSVMDVERFH